MSAPSRRLPDRLPIAGCCTVEPPEDLLITIACFDASVSVDATVSLAMWSIVKLARRELRLNWCSSEAGI